MDQGYEVKKKEPGCSGKLNLILDVLIVRQWKSKCHCHITRLVKIGMSRRSSVNRT